MHTPLSQGELLLRAVNAVTLDDGFKIPSTEAENAVKAACSFLSWQKDNIEEAILFANQVTTMLKGCFTAHRSTQARKEKMWEEYHKVRTSTKFREMWGHFIGKSLCVAASPTFYQFITDRMFDELIKSEFKIISGDKSSTYQSLTREEEMALRYVAGYVCRKVREKLQSSSLPLKDDMIFCLLGLNGDDYDDDRSEAWCNSLDRGGLWHIKDEAYSLFHAIEEVIRQTLTLEAASKQCKEPLHRSPITSWKATMYFSGGVFSFQNVKLVQLLVVLR